MKKIRLLTVDDDKFIRHLVHKTLRSQYSEFDIQEAENGRKAQAMLQRHSFDLVLCDWEMPEMTGLELLEWVRMQTQLEGQPFILVTSLDKKDNVVKALQAGVDDYIAKPFTPEQLFNKVMKQLVKSGRLTQEEAASMGRKERIAASGGAEVLATGGGAGKPKKVRKGPKGKALLVYGEDKTAVTLREINKREALLLVKREDIQPELAGLVSLGLVAGSDDDPLKVSVRGYISSLQLAERNPKTASLFIRVQFLKQDAETAELFDRVLNTPI
ncbi:response regulator [Marinospirillum sp.]|uniref:response regulator n=1 Tax=Marinospirillum sp. TaxID=2183934 RepID=UPI00384F3F76